MPAAAPLGEEMLIYLLLLATSAAHARLTVTYTQDRIGALAAEQCLREMFPPHRHVQLQESDGACIIYCVLRKFRIIDTGGHISLDTYRKHVKQSHQLDQRALESGRRCADAADAAPHSKDVCKKAKVFNDCTHLYRMRFY